MKTVIVEIVVQDNDVELCERKVWKAADEFFLPVCTIGNRNSTQDEIHWAEKEARMSEE